MKQKDAVFAAIINVCGKREGKYELTKDEKTKVNNIVFQGIMTSEVEYTKELDEKSVSEYVPGMVSNWLRKDTRLSGGTKYTPKNPGSRAGQGDAQIKELRKLLATQTDSDSRAEIQGFINDRLGTLNAAKVKNVEIDMSVLPAALQKKYA